MANNVTIDGATVDADSPCALAKALTAVRLKIVTGGGISEYRTQDFNGGRTIRYSAANLKALDDEIARQTDLCTQSTGGRKARFAIRAGQRRIP